MANKKQKRYGAIVFVEVNCKDITQAQNRIERMNEEILDTYHGESNILGLFEMVR